MGNWIGSSDRQVDLPLFRNANQFRRARKFLS
jgi:hypothetical protein